MTLEMEKWTLHDKDWNPIGYVRCELPYGNNPVILRIGDRFFSYDNTVEEFVEATVLDVAVELT